MSDLFNLAASQRTHRYDERLRQTGVVSSFAHNVTMIPRNFGSQPAKYGGIALMIAAIQDLPADAIAYFGKHDYVILINLALPYSVREFLTNQLLGLIESEGPPLGLTVPSGQGARMLAAPLADPLTKYQAA